VLSDTARAIPLVVFDIGESGTTMMNGQLVHAFDDLVVAIVSSEHEHYFEQFQCAGQSLIKQLPKHVRLDATRAVLAGILQTAWGVAPSYQTWRSTHNSTSDDFLFATGLTP